MTRLFTVSSVTMKPTATSSSKRTFRRIVFFAYLVAVLGATLAPLSGGTYAAISGLDKAVHVALFGGVAVLLCWNISSLNPSSASSVVAVTVAFAALIELVQSALWYRSGDLWDLLAGSLGALLGVGFAMIVVNVRRRLKEPSA
jgi:glycopeptide antibiotics resistance protein